MEQFKRAQVLMLPTDKIDLNTICLNNVTGLFLCTKEHLIQNVFNTLVEYKTAIPQHLYIISDDEIKEGDHVFNTKDNHYGGIINKNNLSDARILSYIKKIISTTDTSLKLPYDSTTSISKDGGGIILPQPSQQFITKYIESYNKGEVINNVIVEYKYKGKEYVDEQDAYGYDKQIIKVNPNDNTINIKEVKDSWNREALHIIADHFYSMGIARGRGNLEDKIDCNQYTINDYINQNL